jgi:phosphoglycolate phosphatase
MVIKGILFDKDGTLIKFKEIWSALTLEIIEELLDLENETNNDGLRQKLAHSIGLDGEEIDERGFLASGTTQDIAKQFNRVLSKEEPGVYPWLKERIHTKTKEREDCILPTCDVRKLLSTLKEKGIVVGVATSDDYETTCVCMDKIGVSEYIDFIGTGDRYNKKPDPQVVEVFCKEHNLQLEEVAMVGDTICDMKLAVNSKIGCGVGVLSGVGSKETLQELATYVVGNMEHMIDKNGKFIWE